MCSGTWRWCSAASSNLKDRLPKNAQAYVDRVLREAYGSTSVDAARKRLRTLLSWLESNGHEDAAASLREGMEETLTVLKLELPASLRRSLATTNAIENTLGTVPGEPQREALEGRRDGAALG